MNQIGNRNLESIVFIFPFPLVAHVGGFQSSELHAFTLRTVVELAPNAMGKRANSVRIKGRIRTPLDPDHGQAFEWRGPLAADQSANFIQEEISLRFPAMGKGSEPVAIEFYLDRMEVLDRKHKTIHTLKGDEKRRFFVAFARKLPKMMTVHIAAELLGPLASNTQSNGHLQ